MTKENITVRLDFCLSELNYFLDLREKYLRKDKLTKKESEIFDKLQTFTSYLPISLDSETSQGFKSLKEFAKKIGENKTQ